MTDEAEFRTRCHKPEREGTASHASCLERTLAPALKPWHSAITFRSISSPRHHWHCG